MSPQESTGHYRAVSKLGQGRMGALYRATDPGTVKFRGTVKTFLLPLAAVAALGSASAQSADPRWVPGSTQKICQLIGDTDFETGRPTLSRTATNYGLNGNDLGYSFQHNGKVWLAFGDSQPTATFNGKPNAQTDPPRTADDNDSIAYTTVTDPTQCLKLDFVRDSIGAYQNPVVLNAQGKPAITLSIDEVPLGGIDDGGRMFVFFGTDNNVVNPTLGDLGAPTRSVVAVSDDEGVTYRYLYDFSAPPCSRCQGANFINMAIIRGSDHFIYFFGSQGGALYRKSPVYLARKASGTLASAGGQQYFTGFAKDGVTPNWSNSESDAVVLFADPNKATGDAGCTGEIGGEYNTILQRWVLLYNCLVSTPSNPNGIYMRTAPQPWGPWSPPETIFNPTRDRGNCFFIHRGVTATLPACDTAGNRGREGTQGGPYGPYILAGSTTASANNSATFYFTLSPWNPYATMLMKASVQNASATAPIIGLVANAEGESSVIAPNTWVEIKGLNLARPGANRIWQSSDFASGQMPTTLDGVSVTVNGKAAYVYYISPAQVNILTPPDPISGPVTVTITVATGSSGGASASYTAPAQTTSPSFFVFDTLGNLAATHADGSLIGATTLYPGKTTPAKPGETILLYANGFGATSVPVVRGSYTQTGDLTPVPAVTIGGLDASVTFAGLISPGLYQFNVVVPALTPDGNQHVSASINGVETQGNAMVAVQR